MCKKIGELSYEKNLIYFPSVYVGIFSEPCRFVLFSKTKSFIFTPNDEIKDSEKIRVHEYGHCIQSIVLGPLFLILGIISLVWGRHPYFDKLRKERKLRYTSCFVESLASKWGELATGEEAIWD